MKIMNTIIKTCLTAVLVLSATLVNAENNKNNNGNSTMSITKSVSYVASDARVTRIVNYKTSYIKDEQGRVINKIVYKWADDSWRPLGEYSVYYGDEENILTYAQWDRVNHTFTKNPQQQHFDSNEYPVLIVDSGLE